MNIKAFNLGDATWALATEQLPYTQVVTGEIISGTVRATMPNVPVKYVYFQGWPGNSGTVYFGGTGVTAPNGTADATSGIPLTGGQFSPWHSIDNLNRMGHIASASAQRLIYYGML
jgi:hypothetical protein